MRLLRISLPESNKPASASWKTRLRRRLAQRKIRPGRIGVCAVHRKVLGNQKLLYVNYSPILSRDPDPFHRRRLGMNILSETASKVANYNWKLDKLMRELRDQAPLRVRYDV